MAGSHIAPVIVFKHSQSCGASLMALRSLDGGEVPAPIHQVVVQQHRAVSNRLAAVLGVRHESPQVFVVARGMVAWHSSHAGVTGERVATAFERATASFTSVAPTA